MAYKIKVIQIEDHVSELKIKGWINSWNFKDYKPMAITGVADGKRFAVKTSGNNTLGEIVKMIVGELK